MSIRPLPTAVLFVSLATAPLSASADGCKIGRIAELPVTMNGLRPMVTAKINGVDAQFIADSGAFYSLISPANAAEYNLSTSPSNIVVRGLGGARMASVTSVKEFTLAGVPIHNVQFIVGGSQIVGAVGLLGQNVFMLGDVEYDLSHGAIRLLKAEGCGSKSVMAYWATDGQAYSVLDIPRPTASSPNTTGVAFLNGTKLQVLFDTGAGTSLLSLRAATRAGVTPDTPGVVPAGLAGGVGQRGAQAWIGSFDSFKIGDEEIKHTQLRFGDLSLPDADMLLGADFFLSHRVYVASSQRKLYFTYNGGPVFNLTAGPIGPPGRAATTRNPAPLASPAPSGSASAPALVTGEATAPSASSASAVEAAAGAAALADAAGTPGESSAAATTEAAPSPVPTEQPTDAAGFSRRGAAYAARRDFEHAIADFTRACELAPTVPEYFYQRGEARLGTRQPGLAFADFDKAIDLNPDYVPALMARAALRLSLPDPKGDAAPAALVDLDKVNATVAKEADVRLALGNLYARADALEKAIAQYDVWLDEHLKELRTPDVLTSRCRARAMLGTNFDKALADCNRAVKERPQAVIYLDSRGLTYLRMGDYDKALKDYDAVLAAQPKNPWSLYGRGLAKLHKGMAQQGQADIDASKIVNPRVADEAAKHGLVP
jgi:tetratricopeptide (TPR) repeat protein/predicted aspartyl protease